MFGSFMFTAPSVFVAKCLGLSQCISVPGMNPSPYELFPHESKGRENEL